MCVSVFIVSNKHNLLEATCSTIPTFVYTFKGSVTFVTLHKQSNSGLFYKFQSEKEEFVEPDKVYTIQGNLPEEEGSVRLTSLL